VPDALVFREIYVRPVNGYTPPLYRPETRQGVFSRTMSQVPAEHRRNAPERISCAIVTVSDTRTPETDAGGDLVAELLIAAGHAVINRDIVPDEPSRLRPLLESLCSDADIGAVLLTGGTGISRRDQTYEVVRDLLDKELSGYGELFRMLSYQEIGAAAMMSRAVGGIVGRTVVLTMPGSPAAVRLAMEKLIVPELSHMVGQATKE